MNNRHVCDAKTHLIALGQAGFLIQNKKGETLAVDPYFSDCVERIEKDHSGYKRLQPKLYSPASFNLDILVCTHYHRDHFDIDSVPIIMKNPRTKLFCPIDCERDVNLYKIDTKRVFYIKPSDHRIEGDFTLHFINCDHGALAPYAVGIIIETDGLRFLEVGDTALRLDRINEYLSLGPIDILIGPINGMFGNMNEDELATLSSYLKPKITIPCHYGMFSAHRGNLNRFCKIMEGSDNKYLIMSLGEEYIIGE